MIFPFHLSKQVEEKSSSFISLVIVNKKLKKNVIKNFGSLGTPGYEVQDLAKDLTASFDGLMYLKMSELMIDYLKKNSDLFDDDSVETLKEKIILNKPVSDELVIESLVNSLKYYEQWNAVKAILISDFPKNIQQAKISEKFVKLENFKARLKKFINC